jgi:quercetin dioxygenase-like cupin family protein
MTFIKANPGNGVPMHNHDTNENFLVIEGKWEVSWEGSEGTQTVRLGALDFIALPPFVHRRFECVEAAEGKADGLMLGIVGARSVTGTPAAVEYSPEAQAEFALAERDSGRASP